MRKDGNPDHRPRRGPAHQAGEGYGHGHGGGYGHGHGGGYGGRFGHNSDRRQANLAMFLDTMNILEQGYYRLPGKHRAIPLKLTPAEMTSALVYLPKDQQRLFARTDFTSHVRPEGARYNCENTDSFSLARRRMQERNKGVSLVDEKPVLVLNLANPVHPGGGVRRGATAQEEDLCRKSSLLLSIEGTDAASYYQYNSELNSVSGSDSLVISPHVEILKDERGELLQDTVVVAVMSCAAPIMSYGLMDLTKDTYEQLMHGRILAMLKTAAALGYQDLVLGAFGCGAFGNDARFVAKAFETVLESEDQAVGCRIRNLFRQVDFAVLDRSEHQYNYSNFARRFYTFPWEEVLQEPEGAELKAQEDAMPIVGEPQSEAAQGNAPQGNALQADGDQSCPDLRDRIRGCLFGGAAGDALGYPVEFMSAHEIFSRFGDKGITSYMLDPVWKKALISDDTQMTLFTANGLLLVESRRAARGVWGKPRDYVAVAYLDWLKTQGTTMADVRTHSRFSWEGGFSWLLDVPELYSRRAPGMTCLSALRDEADAVADAGELAHVEDYVALARNDSKGCGGIMRVAPLALLGPVDDICALDYEAAQLAAITHGHSLGYMPAAVLVHILQRLVFPQEGTPRNLKDIIAEAREAAETVFKGDPHLKEMTDLMDLAVELAGSGDDDLTCIKRLGEGWVAEETLAIALFCVLRHQKDFSGGLVAAVNHSGDSASTGAVTGNILGAMTGFAAMEESWKQNLELSDVILEMADDLDAWHEEVTRPEGKHPGDWEQKYLFCERPGQ